MYKKFLTLSLASAILITFACQNTNDETVTGKSLTGSASDEIVTTSVTDVYGHTLYMEFNNSQGTAAFTLGDDMILLKQDTMASGVRFSNEHYIYTEHQGEIRLTRDGQVIFEHQN